MIYKFAQIIFAIQLCFHGALPFSLTSMTTERFSKLDRSRSKPIVSPSVAKADFCNLLDECASAVAGGAEMLHFSIQDGRFVPKISFGPGVVKALRPHLPDTVFDVKLGVIEPEHRLTDFAKSGADIISFHPEATLQPAAVVQKIKDEGCAAGLVVNPGTSIESIKYMLDQVDIVVIMLVSPGWGGPKYIPAAVEKIKELRQIFSERQINPAPLIEVDGGVSASNVQMFLDAGANVVVAGGSVFSSENKKAAIDSLRGSAAESS